MTEIKINPCRICGRVPEIEVYSDNDKTVYNLSCRHSKIELDVNVRQIYDRPSREIVITDWNKENPQVKRENPRFSEKERAYFENRYNQLRTCIENIKHNPEWANLTPNVDMFIWNRLNQLAAMSYDELMDEIEADYVIFGYKDIVDEITSESVQNL